MVVMTPRPFFGHELDSVWPRSKADLAMARKKIAHGCSKQRGGAGIGRPRERIAGGGWKVSPSFFSLLEIYSPLSLLALMDARDKGTTSNRLHWAADSVIILTFSAGWYPASVGNDGP